MLNQRDVMDIIDKGENPYVEFKEDNIKPNDLAGEIVSFANMEGGTILIGVSDSGELKGILDNNMEEKVIVSREELMRLFQASGAIHFDISPVNNTSKRDLDMNLIRDYFLKYNVFDLYEETEESVDRILLNAGILSEGLNTNVCTVGGLLIFGKKIDDILPQSGISFAHFNGNEITEELIDKKQVSGNLPELVEQTLLMIRNNIKTPSNIVGAVRVEKEVYPLMVLREALVNALIHRNYSIIGSKIRILMFADRIEFHSPGKLPNTVTIDKMKIGVSYSRNPFLVKYMENLRYIDQLGRGIPMIMKSMENLGAREPQLKEMGEEFILTLYRAN